MTEQGTPPRPSVPPTPTRVRDADATRARVLIAAESLFARKGFDGTRLREVAEDARVTVPLVCHHFRDKDGLYAAVIERGLERYAALGWEVLRKGQTAAEQLTGFVTGTIDLISQEPVITALLHREMADGGTRAGPIAQRWLIPLKNAATEALERAQVRGEVRSGIDLDMLVLWIASAVIYPNLAAPLVEIVWGEDPRSHAFVERRKRAILDMLHPLMIRPIS